MSKTDQQPTVDILGVQIDIVTMEQAASAIVEYATSKKPAAYVTKPYVEFLDLAANNNQVRDLLNNGLMTLPDSVALQWAALYLSKEKRSFARLISTLTQIIIQPDTISTVIPERFAGADFSWLMLEKAASNGLRLYLVGSPQGGTIKHTATIIQARLPELIIAGTFDGYEVNDKEDELVKELIDLKPDLILIGIGFPRQEQLMSRITPRLESGILIGEGGTFDYDSFGGTKKRAPQWMRRTGLEWLWRLLLQPKRLARQLAIPRFIWKVYHSTK